MANYFQLSNGVRIASGTPIDGDRYVATDLAARDNIVFEGRAFEGLQVYIESGDTANTGLWLLSHLGADIASTTWKKIGDGSFNPELTNLQSGDTLIYSGGTWVNSAVTDIYLTGMTVHTTTNVLTASLTNGEDITVDLTHLVDSDSYVVGGEYDPRSGGTIDFVTNSGYSFAVSGISNASMDSLSDTNLTATTLADGQILVYSGDTWYNSAVSFDSGVDDKLDNDLTATMSAGGVDINDFFSSGTTFEEMFRAILSPTIKAELGANPSVNLVGVPTSLLEVGESYDMTLSPNFNRGTINSRENYPTDNYITRVGVLSSATYSGNGTVTSTDIVNGNATGIAIEGIMSWTITANYNSAVTPLYYNSDGVEQHNLDSSRVSGTRSNTRSRTGAYKYFIGESGGTLSTSSTDVRALESHFRTTSNFSFSYLIPANSKYFAFFIQGSEKIITTATHVESNSEEKLNFNISGPYTISDGGSGTASYYKYEQFIGGVGYTADANYNITLG